MSKRLALGLAALLVIPLLLAACDTSSSDAGEEYIEAVMTGDEAKALELACAGFEDETQLLLAHYADQNLHHDSLDLKYDIGKAGNTSALIVTGSYNYGDEELPRELVLSEKRNSRIILDMEKTGDDWCVAEGSVFEGVASLDATVAAGDAEDATEGADEPAEEDTEAEASDAD